jgi:hypothetical protein
VSPGYYTSTGRLLQGVAFCFALLGGVGGCKRFERKHVPVEKVEELGYPTCPANPTGPTQKLVAEQHLRSGPAHTDKSIVEHYSIRERDCLYVVTVRQEWPMSTADVEVLYDQKLMPLRIWKRMTLPGLPDAGEKADIRRYELRTDPVSVKRRQMSGAIDYELLKGGRPVVVIGPGRGLISMWIKRAKLAVGQKVRELAIDVRALEKIGLVTLRREENMVHELLGPVRVYTIYGREAVFTDENDVVIGDLAGMLPDRVNTLPPPPAVPLYGTLDPVHTP